MPFVNIKVAEDNGLSEEQKLQVIKGVTQVLYDVLGKDPETTSVIIEEISTANWGKGGDSLRNRRKKQ